MGARNGKAAGENFRKGYPDHKENDPTVSANLEFYKGTGLCQPNRLTIDQLHEEWWGKYSTLEREHGYIQWLFPIREDGMNAHAQMLMLHERDAIRADPACRARVIQSYRLFLDFMGLELVDEQTGEVQRGPHYEERFSNLREHSHNNLRITRILKCLAEMGFAHLQAPLVRLLAHEALETSLLAPLADSLANWFVHVVMDDVARNEIIQYCVDHGCPPDDDTPDGNGARGGPPGHGDPMPGGRA